MQLIEKNEREERYKDGNTNIIVRYDYAVKTQEEVDQLLKEIAQLYIKYLA